MARDFPNTIYVARVNEGGTSFLVAGDTPADIGAEPGSPVYAARYVLAGEGVVHTYTEYVEGGDEARGA